MIIRDIRPDEFDASLDLWAAVFDKTPRNHFKRYFYGDPWFKPKYTRICEAAGRIVSAVHIIRSEVRYGNTILVMGGIANVGTSKEHRGKGYSSETMKSAIETMTKDGMDFSILFTNINQFYERLGYSTVSFEHGVADLKPSLAPTELPYTIRDYRPDDSEAVVSIFNEFNSDVTLSVIRTPEYWSGFAINQESETFHIQVAEYNGEVVGYMANHTFESSYGIAELCCRKGNEGALKALMRNAWKRAMELHAEGLVYRLPNKPEINAAISEVAIPSKPRNYTNMMMKVLNLDGMIEKILPELSKRATSIGKVTISADGVGEITLDIAPGKVRISDQPSDKKVELTQEQLLYIIFGYRKPGDVLPVHPSAGLLAEIFPYRQPLFYPADGF